MCVAKHISTAGNYLITDKSRELEKITINTTSAGAITVYNGVDNTGEVLAVIQASVLPQTLCYGVQMNNGIFIVTAGDSDITVMFE